MLIELTKVLSQDGNILQQDVHLDLNQITVQGETYPVTETAPVQLTVTNSGKGVLVIAGTASVRAVIGCARCLEDVDYDFALRFERKVDMKLSAEEMNAAEEEYNFIEKDHLNVDTLVQNELLVNWPIRVLCNEDCKGICSRCGANLNRGECGCDREALDPRMAAIQDIFSKFKEV